MRGNVKFLLERNLPSHIGSKFSGTYAVSAHIKLRAFVFSLVKRCQDVPYNECR